MGTIAEKLTYLNDTKQLLKENINNLGGNLTNEPFRQYASVLEGIYERLPKVSGIGASLSLSPSMVGKIKLNEIQGDTLQDGTPTPSSPVPIQSVTGLQNVEICGKNLFDNNNPTVKANTVTWTPTETGGTISNSGTWGTGIQWHFKLDTSKQYTFKGNGFINNCYCYIRTYTDDTYSTIKTRILGDGAGNITNTFQPDSEYVGISFLNSSAISNISISNLQLELRNQSTTYEQYNGNTYEVNLGNIELNKIGDYQDSIKKSTGKQLFDKDNANIINGNLADGGTLSSTNNARTLYIPCKNNTTYTITKAQAVYFRVAQFTNIPAIGDSYISRTKDDTANSITFTTTTGNYLAVTYWYNSSTNTEQQVLDSIMINEGSTALPYEPYGKVWYITKNIKKITLNGNESWGIYNGVFLIQSINDYKDSNNIPYSNYFKGVVNVQGTADMTINNTIAVNLNHVALPRLFIKCDDYSTTEQFQTWLSSHNVEVKYILATPIYEVIANTELIEDLESLYNAKSEDGTTNINVTSEDLSMILNVGVLKGDA